MTDSGTARDGAIEEAKIRVLRLAARFLIVAPAVYLAVLFGVYPEHGNRALGPALILALAAAALLILHRGRAAPAARLLIYGSWVGIALAAAAGGGVHAPQIVALPLTVLICGWILGPRQAVLIAALSIALALALALATEFGLLPQPAPAPAILVWIPVTVVVALVCLLTWFIVGGYEGRLAEVRQLGAELIRRVEELAAEKGQLRLIAENVPAMIAYNDREMVLRYANRRYLDFFGHDGSGVIGRHIGHIIGEEAFQKVAPLLQRAIGGEAVSYRAMRRSAAGEDRMVEMEVVPDRGADGEVRGSYALMRDITEQVRAEEELRRSEDKFARVFRSSPLAVAITRLADGCYMDVNDAFVRLFGWRREEAIGRTSLELGKWARPADRDAWAATLRQAGRVNNLEVDFRTRSGDVRRVLLSAELIDLAGEPCALVMTADISELRESEARLREAQRIGRIGSWEMDLASTRLHWSDEIYRIFELAPEEFGGTFEAFLETVHPDDLPAIREVYRKSVHVKGAFEIDHRILTPGGRVKYVREHWEIFRDEAGKPVRSVGTIHDVTEQVLARQEIQSLNAGLETRVRERTAELQAANKELESFAYSISHDLRAPLRGIDGFSHLLAEEYGERLDDTGRDYLERVRCAAQRMGSLIDDILELSRVTRQGMRREKVDLSQLAAELVEERVRSKPQHRVQVAITPGCSAYGDPQLLRVMMQNLLENAWKYSAKVPAPKIDFGSAAENGERMFYVRDNGVGFDMQYAGRLFAPFQRLHSPEEFEGTGIGLATVARVVNRHGGRVWAESSPGQGAIFRFTLGQSFAETL